MPSHCVLRRTLRFERVILCLKFNNLVAGDGCDDSVGTFINGVTQRGGGGRLFVIEAHMA